MRIIATIAVLAALIAAGAGCEESGRDGNAKSGTGQAFQGDPALDGLKPGDCLKYPELEACNFN